MAKPPDRFLFQGLSPVTSHLPLLENIFLSWGDWTGLFSLFLPLAEHDFNYICDSIIVNVFILCVFILCNYPATKSPRHKKELSSLRSQLEYWNTGILGFGQLGMLVRWKYFLLTWEEVFPKNRILLQKQHSTIPLFHVRGKNSSLKKSPLFSMSCKISETYNYIIILVTSCLGG